MGRRGRPMMGLGQGPTVRGGRRAMGQRLGPNARAQLLEAHQLKQAGRFAEAAARFDQMGAIARERARPRMSAYLFAQAAQCHARAGNQQALIASTQNAVADAKLEGDADHSARTFGELVGSLQGTAFAGAKPQIESAIRDALGVAPAAPAAPAAANRSQQRSLPGECEACGAPVSATLVKFTAEGHADCPYCGSILTA